MTDSRTIMGNPTGRFTTIGGSLPYFTKGEIVVKFPYIAAYCYHEWQFIIIGEGIHITIAQCGTITPSLLVAMTGIIYKANTAINGRGTLGYRP